MTDVNYLSPMMIAVLVDPLGNRLDVTANMSDVGMLSQELEDGLLNAVHGDLSLELSDDDGSIEVFLSIIDTGEPYRFELWRDHIRRRPYTYELVFAGVLDLPWSVKYERKDRTVSVEVFSATKVLDNTSAEGVKRDFTYLGTASTTATSKTVTLSSVFAGLLLSGDVIRISNGSVSEEQVVDWIIDPSNIRTRAAWTNTMSAATIEVMTPYHRWVRPDTLTALLVSEAGMLCGSCDLTLVLSADIPFLTAMNANGISFDGQVGSIVETDDNRLEVAVRSGSSGSVGTYHGTPQDGFGHGNPDAWNVNGDWHPYMATRPSSFAFTNAGTVGDDSFAAFDHNNLRWYNLNPVGDAPIDLEKHGTFHATLTAVATLQFGRLDYDADNDQVWIAYRGTGPSVNKITVYDVGSTSQTDIAGGTAGHLRTVQALGLMFWCSEDFQTFKLYDIATRAVTKTITGDAIPPGVLAPWTLRYFGSRWVMAYRYLGRVRLRIWNTAWEAIADYDCGIAHPNASYAYDPVISQYDDPELGSMLIVHNRAGTTEGNNVFSVLSPRYDGVIPYADLSGLSVSSGLNEVALLTLGLVQVSLDGLSVSILPRDFHSDIVHEIATPLEESELPLWEDYRTSVQVTGTDQGTGAQFTVVSGASPSRRLEVDTKFGGTETLGLLIADSYRTFLSVARREREILDQETGVVFRPLDVLVWDGSRWMVVSSEVDLLDREQHLRVVEVV